MALFAADRDIFNNAVELEIIPRPGVGHQPGQRIVIYPKPRGKSSLQPAQTALYQGRNTVATFPQGRDDDLKGAQGIIKLTAKAVLLHQIPQIDRGGSNDFDIHRHQTPGLKPGKYPLLDDLQ